MVAMGEANWVNIKACSKYNKRVTNVRKINK